MDLKENYKKKFMHLNLPSYQETFFNIALDWAKKSSDSRTKVGCVIANNDNEIVVTGYNGPIRDVDDTLIPNIHPDKYPFYIHGEHNAVLNAARQGRSTKGCNCYVTLHPCHSCCQILYQAGIKNVFYLSGNMYKDRKFHSEEQLELIEHFKELTKGKIHFIECTT
jgi:dCMP deaminase